MNIVRNCIPMRNCLLRLVFANFHLLQTFNQPSWRVLQCLSKLIGHWKRHWNSNTSRASPTSIWRINSISSCWETKMSVWRRSSRRHANVQYLFEKCLSIQLHVSVQVTLIYFILAKILILLYEFSIQECQCFPWNFPKPVENKKFPMCTFYGNHCFNSKFQNLTYRTEQCECLPGCNRINYKFQVDSVEKFSEKQIKTFCPDNQATAECAYVVMKIHI